MLFSHKKCHHRRSKKKLVEACTHWDMDLAPQVLSPQIRISAKLCHCNYRFFSAGNLLCGDVTSEGILEELNNYILLISRARGVLLIRGVLSFCYMTHLRTQFGTCGDNTVGAKLLRRPQSYKHTYACRQSGKWIWCSIFFLLHFN